MTDYTTVAEVKAWLRLDDLDDDLVTAVVAATNAWATDLPDAPTTVTAQFSLGCRMLAARLYRRRNTPGGVEAFGDAGTVYVPRRDADVDSLLRLGPYARPSTSGAQP